MKIPATLAKPVIVSENYEKVGGRSAYNQMLRDYLRFSSVE